MTNAPVWLTIISLVFSLIAIVISCAAYFANKRSSKAALLHQVKNSVDSAKTQVENVGIKLAHLSAKSGLTQDEGQELTNLKIIFDSSVEKVLNAYEDGCQKYEADLILRDEFKKSYFEDIREYVAKFPEKFSPPLTRYTYITKLYTLWHKPH